MGRGAFEKYAQQGGRQSGQGVRTGRLTTSHSSCGGATKDTEPESADWLCGDGRIDDVDLARNSVRVRLELRWTLQIKH